MMPHYTSHTETNHFSETQMLTMTYQTSEGWSLPEIKPYAPITVSPSAQCLHYGQTVFEDIKVFNINDDIHIFQPLDHLNKFNRSLRRIEMPEVNPDQMLTYLSTLLEENTSFSSNQTISCAQLRLFMFASESKLGVSKSDTYECIAFLSPLASTHMSKELNAMQVLVEEKLIKSISGGAGTSQFGGNYASTFTAQIKANQLGFDQALWLDGKYRHYVEEVGNMNVFFVISDKIITPQLNDSILPGVTRQSIILLAKQLGYSIEERDISIDEVISESYNGHLTEIFCTDTLNTITYVDRLKYKEENITLHNTTIAQHLLNTYVDIQLNNRLDENHWNYSLPHGTTVQL
ncbi:aminotransferase class IV [Mammaliicoccus sp. Dog046]|uniref:aminotransferase class IV n=1 Tax=Mammaliicoccus sp. Dog046 TaxID=3034233 RepID=UPI002B25BF75|nr:aminotransferase class IV [Mammaliicoccus sp. Dog046]WQK84642.1 aminotransferase class IV [Mammaliicoccus sp. Dog046]